MIMIEKDNLMRGVLSVELPASISWCSLILIQLLAVLIPNLESALQIQIHDSYSYSFCIADIFSDNAFRGKGSHASRHLL